MLFTWSPTRISPSSTANVRNVSAVCGWILRLIDMKNQEERYKREIRRLQLELKETKKGRDEWEKIYRNLLREHEATLDDLRWYQDNCTCDQ